MQYLWLGLERLAYGAENVDFASGQAGGVGGFAGHDGVWLVVRRMCWVVPVMSWSFVS